MTTMVRVAEQDRLRLDLAAARRARVMITDPLSISVLGAYIAELERTLHSNDAAFSSDR